MPVDKELIKAVDLSIVIWEKLAELGCEKKELPKSLWNQIKDLYCQCPLCEYRLRQGWKKCEEVCPLKSCGDGAPHQKWQFTCFKEKKKVYAKLLLEQLKTWRENNVSTSIRS